MGARQRWAGKAVLARLGISTIRCSTSSDSVESVPPAADEEEKKKRPSLLPDSSALFRRALSARMDLALRYCSKIFKKLSHQFCGNGIRLSRRRLCGLPVRELVLEHSDEDLSLYKASVDLMLKAS